MGTQNLEIPSKYSSIVFYGVYLACSKTELTSNLINLLDIRYNSLDIGPESSTFSTYKKQDGTERRG